jgi:hypothetical protein
MSDLAGPLSGAPRSRASGVTLPIIDHIWRVRGEVPVDPALSPEEVFARLDPLLRTPGTTLEAESDALSYAKHKPAAQDKLATFNRGSFRIEPAGAGAVLRFDLFSHALLLSFLAPLLFLGFAQAAIAINAWEAAAEASEKSEKKDEEKPKPVRKLNPVDEFLGAPTPEDPNKKKDEKEDEGRHSPDEAYFLAGLFAVIYLVGRWLEPWLLRRRLRAALSGPPIPD